MADFHKRMGKSQSADSPGVDSANEAIMVPVLVWLLVLTLIHITDFNSVSCCYRPRCQSKYYS